jgi:two-component system phosphate regulon sensor histidine kinase PhoR
MALRKRTVTLIVPVMVLALLGLIGLQAYLIDNAFQLREQAFNRNVWSALAGVPLKLQARETITEAFRVQGFSFDTHVGPPRRVRMTVSDGMAIDTVIADSGSHRGNRMMTFDAPKRKGSFFYQLTTDSTKFIVQVANGLPGPVLRKPASEKERATLVSRVIDNLWIADTAGLERRIDTVALDSILTRSLRESGIPLECSSGVLTGQADSTGAEAVRFARPGGTENALRKSEFRTPLSPFDLPGPRVQLAIDFPGRDIYLLRQLWPVLLASVLFIILIAAGFVITVRTIMRQQRLADLMVEFINNMTHEFKTPLSTVALASEAIGRADVVTRKPKVLSYNRMIAEETLRMKKQVDRILEFSQLEEGDFELTVADVDMHEVVRAAAKNFVLQVESRGGTLTLDLRAEAHTVKGDAMHLSTIVHNLLDNANKYSPEAPEVAVASRNEPGRLLLTVTDKGVGIAAEHVKKVFDKYYRVSTGNLHTVKGFGIGLSYVRLLVAAHGGEVSITSQPGSGTEVALRFPTR